MTFWRRSGAVRVAAAAAGLVGALVLTGCSGDGDAGDDSASSPAPSATESSTAGGSDPGSDAGSGGAGAADELAGSWLATTDGKAVALVITGKQAALFATGGSICSGTAGEESGMRMLRLKCTDGSKNRATGMVDSVNGSSMKVTWEGGLGTETYTKAEGGKLPTGLPTASLGAQQ
ncbi:hypothetical protein RM641_35845 [Streptomyces sp. DSM 41921]|uniref:Secreted protein n=1 Tax=Streptomyces dubilierae TaxID=3075533 RepID=A0ABU2PKW1_9ACTN|nr:hypothetical protein [Streptomyces sp. DSM 41921]MDT0392802.1 hypothetical protein [Streptomyces sp. DSM 41921]